MTYRINFNNNNNERGLCLYYLRSKSMIMIDRQCSESMEFLESMARGNKFSQLWTEIKREKLYEIIIVLPLHYCIWFIRSWVCARVVDQYKWWSVQGKGANQVRFNSISPVNVTYR